MGIFKDSINLCLQWAFLLKLGFRYTSGARGENGYTKIINHSGNERLWITVNPSERKVYLYNEWDCSGELWSRTHEIPQSALDSETEFANWLDEKIGDD